MKLSLRNYLNTRIQWLELELAAVVGRRGGAADIDAERRAAGLRQRLRRLEAADAAAELPTTRLRSKGFDDREVELLMMAACSHLGQHIGELAASCHGHSGANHLSPWLCLEILCDTRGERLEARELFDPDSALIRRGLLRVRAREGAGANPLRHGLVPSRFLVGFVRGKRILDSELAIGARLYAPRIALDDIALNDRERAVLEEIGDLLVADPLSEAATDAGGWSFVRGVAVLLSGAPGTGKTLIAKGLVQRAGARLLEVDAERLSTAPPDVSARVVEQAFREADFFDEWLLLDGVDHLFACRPEGAAIDRWTEAPVAAFRASLARHPVTAILTAGRGDDVDARIRDRLAIYHEVPPLSRDLMRLVWQRNLEAVGEDPRRYDLDPMADRYVLTPRQIQMATGLAFRRRRGDDGGSAPDRPLDRRSHQSSGEREETPSAAMWRDPEEIDGVSSPTREAEDGVGHERPHARTSQRDGGETPGPAPMSSEAIADDDEPPRSEAAVAPSPGVRPPDDVAGRPSRAAERGQAALDFAAQVQSTSVVSRMAHRVWVSRDRDDLLVPEEVSAMIDEIINIERVREDVLHTWGLGARLQKGLGLCCLLDGPPGTGKTLAAEVIASTLQLPLFMVSIPHVVSKYIGETEKNLRRIFQDASRTRCVILFDEADTLFSKRTEVTSANSRYANMEVGLLLQLIESYRGLVILTTNLKEAIDPAFNRRFHYKLTFPIPEADLRQEIWRHLLPDARRCQDIDTAYLGRTFELSGGDIRSIVLRASYRAALEDRALSEDDLLEVIRQELRSQGRLVREPTS